jgi:hypothetical protein
MHETLSFTALYENLPSELRLPGEKNKQTVTSLAKKFVKFQQHALSVN